MLNLKNVLRHAFIASLVGCFGAASVTSPTFAQELTVGSQAPALDIEHWVQDGNGKFKPVSEFAKGKVYVVEFWATWCGPCIASMPHLAEMQNKFADKGVQIVSISDEDLETVENFLKRKYNTPKPKKAADQDAADESGDQPKTYGDLTSAYCLTTDPDRSANNDYMLAAKQNGIPCAFIVGKDQKIEWIGHPMSMDEVLAQVVEDRWDRAAFAAEFAETQKLELLVSKIRQAASAGDTEEALQMLEDALAEAKSPSVKARLKSMRPQVLLGTVMALAQQGKSEEALAELDSLIEAEKSSEVKKQLSGFRVQLQMQSVMRLAQAGKFDDAVTELEGLIESEKNADTKKQMEMTRVQLLMQDPKSAKFAEAATKAFVDHKDNAGFINAITWSLFEKFESGQLENKALLKASRAAAEAAAETADPATKAAILDTAAHYQFLEGDVKLALKTQTEALKLAEGPMKKEIESFLEVIKEKADK